MRINGVAAGDRELCQAFASVEQVRGDAALTYFEFGTLAAWEVFAAAGLDAIVLEVGLGGRLDATNVYEPDCAIVTGLAQGGYCDAGVVTFPIGAADVGAGGLLTFSLDFASAWPVLAAGDVLTNRAVATAAATASQTSNQVAGGALDCDDGDPCTRDSVSYTHLTLPTSDLV